MVLENIAVRLSPKTLQVGLIGESIQASRSPTMHMREARALGLALRYDLLDLELIEGGAAALPDVLADLEDRGYLGANITHPCKQSVMAHVDELSDDARALGAVNTVVFRGGKRFGHNTDWSGFARSFRRGLSGVKLDRVVQYGCGGAGSAIAYALMKSGTKHLHMFDSSLERAQALAAKIGAQFGLERITAERDVTDFVRQADGIVNCTPIGMAKYPGMPLSPDLLRPALWVAEVVYFPIETESLRRARALGCKTLDGGGMAVFQAAEAFELFTGIKPDDERMLSALQADLAAA